MSQDIVEQLRNAASEAECPIASLEGRAADTIESLRARVAELEADKELVKLWQAQADDREIINAAVVSTEQVEERISLSVRACLNISTDDLRVAADARLGGLFKFKRNFDEQLAEKDQRISDFEAEFAEYRRAANLAHESSEVEKRQQLAAQALTIKTMRDFVNQFLDENDTTDFGCSCDPGVGYTCGQCRTFVRQEPLRKAIATLDNSTEVLQKWLDSKPGDKNG